MESKRTNLGSLLVTIAIFTLIASQIYPGLAMLILGIILVSIQDKTKIDFEKKTVTKYYSVIKITIPLLKYSTNLKEFNQAYLYQISEKGAIQTKTQTLAYKNTEYWIKLKGETEYKVGYITDYKEARIMLETFKNALNYTTKDSIQAKMIKNKIERDKRIKKKLFLTLYKKHRAIF